MARLSLYKLGASTDRTAELGGKGAQIARLLRFVDRTKIRAPVPIAAPETWSARADELARWEAEGGEIDAKALPPPPWLVRSSASVEDGASGSFAGFFASVRVERSEGLADAIRAVLASARAPEMRRYATERGIDPDSIRAHFVLQPFLAAERSGVAFSRDPKNPWSPDGRIEWVEGHLARMLQGEVQPSSVRFSEVGSDPLVRSVVALARALETEFGGPIDLEWILSAGRLYAVQCRPVATYEADAVRRFSEGDGRYARGEAVERFPQAMSPLGWTAIAEQIPTNLRALERYFGIRALRPDRLARAFAGWVYHREDFFKYPGGVRLRIGHLFSPLFPFVDVLFLLTLSPFALLRLRSTSLWKKWLAFRLAATIAEPIVRRIRAEWEGRKRRLAERLRALDVEGARDAEGFARVLAELRELSEDFFEPDLAIFLARETLFKGLLPYLRAVGVSEGKWLKWAGQYPLNHSLRFAEAYRALAEGKGDPESFWREYGHLRFSWDIALGSIGETRTLPPALAEKEPGQAKEPEKLGLVEILPYAIFDRARAVRAAESLHRILEIDEELHFLTGKVLAPSRQVALGIGDRLVEEGKIAAAADVFYLEYAELLPALFGAGVRTATVEERKRVWKRYEAGAPSEELPPRPRELAKGKPAEGAVGVSAGVAEGEALVLESPPASIESLRGKILVTSGPNPSWSPFFTLLGGMVCESGGLLSHGFVAAREHGLPAVSGCAGARSRFRDGMRLRIDGESGRIEILPS